MFTTASNTLRPAPARTGMIPSGTGVVQEPLAVITETSEGLS
jgi:hypothetical protein